MGERNSGYERRKNEFYQTPAWVTNVALDHLQLRTGSVIWEPACGEGKMVDAMMQRGYRVIASDLHDYGLTNTREQDFLTAQAPAGFKAIITNPPFGHGGRQAAAFIRAGLKHLTNYPGTYMAFLLRPDFDHGKTRTDMFRDCRAYRGQIKLMKRIKWFEGGDDEPSQNHSWFIWGPPMGVPGVWYAP